MELSIVIVNYNVSSFLEQCLSSVQRSKDIDVPLQLQVFVVDNASIDGSVEMVRQRFEWVHLIENKENVGFAKANNQAIRMAKGHYVLLLNPDTVLEENTLASCLAFMKAHPNVGGLGVRMLDGKGRFLPESKRGLPTPETAFYKIAGLCKIFPRSARFARYYLGHLDENQTHEVEVLSGAFMMMPSKVLEDVGLLDERFFMYGEDIDLSYRILQKGYVNYYLSEARIIHYKGESTKKGSLNYVKVFYKAMEIFVEKHFKDSLGGMYAFLLKGAIWARASISVISRLFRKFFLPLWDLLWGYGTFFVLSFAWAYFFFGRVDYYQDFYRNVILWGYSALLVGGLLLCGAYRNPISFKRTSCGYGIGLLGMLSIFALLGPQWHYSRFMMVVGTLLSYMGSWGWKKVWGTCMPEYWVVGRSKALRYLLVGESGEVEAVKNALYKKEVSDNAIFVIKVPDSIDRLKEAIRIYKVSEVIFCDAQVPFHQMVGWMQCAKEMGVEYGSYSSQTGHIVGSRLK